MIQKKLLIVFSILLFHIKVSSQEYKIPVTVNDPTLGAPITMGIPFKQGQLNSPDNVRLLDHSGKEVPCQVTLVNTWEPADFSVKWIWIFFFSNDVGNYTLEYGGQVNRMPISGDKVRIKNGQRKGQASFINTGPLLIKIGKKGGGFIEHVLLDESKNGFDQTDSIVDNSTARGSFLDILDDLGIDSSRAIIHRTVREKGSGELHAIVRLEGEYHYNRKDNRSSPFIIRIHTYAGKSYIKVYHTMTYTGVPDKHIRKEGQHANIAIRDDKAILNDSVTVDSAWMEPNDRIAALGLDMNFKLGSNLKYMAGYYGDSWYESSPELVHEASLDSSDNTSVFQNGPKPDRIPPVPNSDDVNRINGFEATISQSDKAAIRAEKASGWTDITGDKYGVTVGIKNFLEEYPKEIDWNSEKNQLTSFLWSPKAGPLSLARASLERDEGMISNFAEGITKTSELIYFFHGPSTSKNEIKSTVNYVLKPSIAHVSSETYANSEVYGCFAPKTSSHEEYERALEYKFDWQLFSQAWEPWYGMLDYGDQKQYYFRGDWIKWQNNEPSIDFMYWLQFMRTGESKYYKAGEAMSRHTMDVDNVHWPAVPTYFGDTNEALDYFKSKNPYLEPTPYLGIGRRHAQQHWTALLSAHVWLKGWVASYYLTGYHRGLDIARLTADSYLRRMWGDHGLTGRRLYLSIWNLSEAWDATKDSRYYDELKDRVALALAYQNGPDQYDNLVIDRYGYSQVYVSHGLYQYYQLTKDPEVKEALIRHARAVRDNPPFNHEYESYFATIHSLVVGYEFTKDESFLNEAIKRSEKLKVDKISKSFTELGTQKEIAEELNKVSHLPEKGYFDAEVSRWPTNWSPTSGLRVFGWTHIYGIPWLLDKIDDVEEK